MYCAPYHLIFTANGKSISFQTFLVQLYYIDLCAASFLTFVADKVRKIRMCQPIACHIIVTYASSHYLKMCPRLSKIAKVLKLVLSNHLHSYFVSASSEDSGETTRMRSLARVLALAYAISNNTSYITVLYFLQEA